VSRTCIWDRPGADEIAATPEAFLAALPGPTLLRVPGRDPTRTRAVVTLLHGNEPSGLRAVHAWLRSGERPAVDVVCWLGGVEAARLPPGFAHRMVPGGRDLNRCFRPPFVGEEGALAEEALGLLRATRPEALVDLHNNTGHNPPYGVGTRVDAVRLGLTGLFARRFVHSTIQLGALTEVMADELRAVTIECGRAGDPAADVAARAGLTRFLETERLPLAIPPPGMTVLGEPVRVCVRPGVRIAFSEVPCAGVDLTLRGDIDRHNFEALLPGVPVGWLGDGADWPLVATGADGEDVSHDYFVLRDRLLETRRAMVPIMMTTDVAAALGDCLFYMVHPRPGADP
jgi:hypothetical protein